MTKGSSSNRKEMIKERILEHQEENTRSRNMGTYNRLSSSHEFLNLDLMIGTKNYNTI